MKKYVYHVSYRHQNGPTDFVGDCIVVVSKPVTTGQDLECLRGAVANGNGGGGTVVLFAFQLLDVEEAD